MRIGAILAALLWALVAMPAQAASFFDFDFSVALDGGGSFAGAGRFTAEARASDPSMLPADGTLYDITDASGSAAYDFGPDLMGPPPAAITGVDAGLGNILVDQSGAVYLLTASLLFDGTPRAVTFLSGGPTQPVQAFFGESAGIATFDIMAAAVPEPASWALLIGGFGVVGGAIRRARRSAMAPAAA